jgi:hypothetical protein
MSDQSKWAARSELDRVNVTVRYRRDLQGMPTYLEVYGYSEKRFGPIWSHSERVDEAVNVDPQLHAILAPIHYHRPRDEATLSRLLRGLNPIEEDPTLPGI